MKSLIVISILSSLLINSHNTNREIRIEVLPENVITYKEKSSWVLNFDFWFGNYDSKDYTLNYINVKVFSKAGDLLTRRHLSNNGLPGAISILNRELNLGKDLYLFNPFSKFPEEVYPYKLVYTFVFNDVEVQKTIYPKLLNPKTRLQLPVTEKVYIDDGNDYFSHHRRVSLNSDAAKALNMTKLAQRFALDFTKIDSLGNKGSGEIKNNQDWYGWGMKVVSPAAGTVLEVRNNVPDNKYEGGQLIYSEEVKNQVSSDISTGNYVIIDHENGEYSLLCHFQNGTIQFEKGEKINLGDYLGNVGLSGDTYYPHLHYQVQTSPDIIDSYGIPAKFNDFFWVTQQDNYVISGFINSGDIVKPNYAQQKLNRQ